VFILNCENFLENLWTTSAPLYSGHMGEGEGGIRRGAPRGPLGEGGVYYNVARVPLSRISLNFYTIKIRIIYDNTKLLGNYYA
tara:strand:- start:413 stop:661 length:249 start_codon:yes stop_codon:yes gene_type:complete